MNNVSLIGNLVKDPEIRYAANNTIPVVSFTLAVNRRVKQGDEKQADFIFCKAFNKTAELINTHITKGRKIGISGEIRTGSYDKDGQKIYTTEVIVNNVYFVDSKKDNGSNNAPGFFPVDSSNDELPF